MNLLTLLFLGAVMGAGYAAYRYLTGRGFLQFDEFDFDEESDSELGYGAEYDEDDPDIDAYILGIDNLSEDALEQAVADMNAGKRIAVLKELENEHPELFQNDE